MVCFLVMSIYLSWKTRGVFSLNKISNIWNIFLFSLQWYPLNFRYSLVVSIFAATISDNIRYSFQYNEIFWILLERLFTIFKMFKHYYLRKNCVLYIFYLLLCFILIEIWKEYWKKYMNEILFISIRISLRHLKTILVF